MPPTPNTKPPPERPQDKVQHVKTADLVPTPDNGRGKPDQAAQHALAASIASVGVLQPLIARPHPKQAGKWDLRAGSRRLLAAKALNLPTVPVIVRATMTDAEAVEITVTENLSRDDLHPIDEGKAINRLLGVGWSTAEVADKLGREPGWVLRRAGLQHLHPRFVELNAREGSPFAGVGVRILEQLARLPQDVQHTLARQIGKTDKWLPVWAESASACQEMIARLLMDLGKAIWALDDATLYPKAADCLHCPKRSNAQPALFDDLYPEHNGTPKGPGRCLDRGCFNEKHRRTVKAKVSKAKAAHPDLALVTTADSHDAADEAKYYGRPVLHAHSVKRVKRDAKGAIAAVVVSGKGAGTLTYVQPPSAPKGQAAKPKASAMTLAQKRKALEVRRSAWVIDRLAAIVDEHLDEMSNTKRPKWLAKGPLADHLHDLACAFLMGVDHAGIPGSGAAAWKLADEYRKGPAGVVKQEHDAAYALLEVWANRLARHGAADLAAYKVDLANVAKYLDVKVAELTKQAAKALPEPKGWTKAPKKPQAVKKTKKDQR